MDHLCLPEVRSDFEVLRGGGKGEPLQLDEEIN
jgi:hypothetical protein